MKTPRDPAPFFQSDSFILRPAVSRWACLMAATLLTLRIAARSLSETPPRFPVFYYSILTSGSARMDQATHRQRLMPESYPSFRWFAQFSSRPARRRTAARPLRVRRTRGGPVRDESARTPVNPSTGRRPHRPHPVRNAGERPHDPPASGNDRGSAQHRRLCQLSFAGKSIYFTMPRISQQEKSTHRP